MHFAQFARMENFLDFFLSATLTYFAVRGGAVSRNYIIPM